MLFRFEPENLECEAYAYAKARANVFYNNQRRFYKGDREDLEQTAYFAVAEAVRLEPNKEQIPEEVIVLAVDTALAAEIKANVKRGSNELDDNGAAIFARREQEEKSPETLEKLATFRRALEVHLTKEQLSVLWNYYVLGKSLKQQRSDIYAQQIGHGKWTRPTIAKLKATLEEAIATLRAKLGPKIKEQIATLPCDKPKESESETFNS